MPRSPFLLNALPFLLPLLSLPLSTAAPSPETTQVCTQIAEILPSKLSFPGTKAYNTENEDYYHAGLAALKPACIVHPDSAEDVAAVVAILRDAPDSVHFAVKAGGHSPNPGHSSIRDGVLVALRDLVGTTLDRERGVAYVKPGGRWWDVYEALDGSGMTVVGGRLGTIGVGGFLTQGGVSFLSGEYGLSADNILEYEVVLANGTIAHISRERYPTVVQAMRGSGSQFGIVTQFTLRAVPITDIYVGVRVYSATREEYYAALQQFISSIGRFPKADTLLALGLPAVPEINSLADIPRTILQLFGGFDLFGLGALGALNLTAPAQEERMWRIVPILYRGAEPPDEVFGEGFNKLELGAKLGMMLDYDNVVGITDQIFKFWGMRTAFRSYTVPVQKSNPRLLTDLEDIFNEISPKFSDAMEGYGAVGVIVQPFPRSFGESAEEHGGNAMGLSGEDNDRFVLEIESVYTNEKDDEIMLEWSREYVRRLDAYMEDIQAKAHAQNWNMETYNPYFMNDANGEQDVTATYKNFETYKALQKEMDPKGLWSTRCGGFKYN